MIPRIFFLALMPTHHYLTPTPQYKTYAGYQMLRINPTTNDEEFFIDSDATEGCILLKKGHSLNNARDLLCNIEGRERLAAAGFLWDVIREDFEDLLRDQQRENQVEHARQKRETSSMNWDNYQRYNTIIDWLEGLAAENPDFVTLEDMGSSHEGRKLLMLKVGTSPQGAETRAIFVDGGIHAREWIAISTATYLLDKVVDTFKTKDNSSCNSRAIQGVDWYFAPLLNPDGYEYSHTNDRMWRKNRSPPPPGSSCYGVDLNRNWDVIGFGLGVTSSNPCRETYKGSRASEPETEATAKTILKYKNNIRIYLTFHSYGQYWLCSWGYKTQLAVDDDKLVRLGRQAVDAIKQVNPSRSYTIGSAGAIFYIAGGASDDFAKAEAEIPYSYTVELPDRGSYGFLLPKSQIKPVGEELWAALGELAKEAARHNLGRDPARDLEIQEDLKIGVRGN